ncbi:MAG: sulfate/molybdate ABC transporter ATP-binding protein [Xanthobacteraceae bacterium]
MRIEVKDLTKRLQSTLVLDRISLEIREREFLGLLGPSGSGKTTLLRILAGLEFPDSGHVLIDERDALKLGFEERQIGFVFQHYALFNHMSVFENIAFGLKVRSRRTRPSRQEIDKRVMELLRLVQLRELEGRFPGQLSGGQRQRVALARALAIDPKVLLLDEPFGALDAKVRQELRDWLRRLHDEVHVTTIFVTHDQEEAMELAEQIVVLNEGRVEQAGSPAELYEHPANPFVMGFVGPVTRMGEQWVRPHDVDVVMDGRDGTVEALVQRVVRLGFEVRLELVLGDGRPLSAQLTRAEAEELEVEEGQIVHVRPHRARVFAA